MFREPLLDVIELLDQRELGLTAGRRGDLAEQGKYTGDNRRLFLRLRKDAVDLATQPTRYDAVGQLPAGYPARLCYSGSRVLVFVERAQQCVELVVRRGGDPPGADELLEVLVERLLEVVRIGTRGATGFDSGAELLDELVEIGVGFGRRRHVKKCSGRPRTRHRTRITQPSPVPPVFRVSRS